MKKMPIRNKQIAKAKYMLYRNYKKNKHNYFTITEEKLEQELPSTFTSVINAFVDFGKAADYANVTIANLVPNIRKRG